MKKYFKLIRIKHYIKNLLILFPVIFSGELFKIATIRSILLAFLSFSFAASVVYIINDIKDKEKDRLHEKKKNRPIASGQIGVKNAIICAIILIMLSIICNYFANPKDFLINYLFIIAYLIINIAYSFGLKNIPLIDITILASGFLIRLFYGAAIVNIQVSNWLYLTVLAVAFYLGLGKRRNEILNVGKNSRPVLQYYTKEFLDKNMYMCLGISIIFYALWATDELNVIRSNNLLIWTVPLIMLILMKYSMNIESDSFGEPVDVVMNDKWLIGMLFIYAIIIVAIIYLGV